MLKNVCKSKREVILRFAQIRIFFVRIGKALTINVFYILQQRRRGVR